MAYFYGCGAGENDNCLTKEYNYCIIICNKMGEYCERPFDTAILPGYWTVMNKSFLEKLKAVRFSDIQAVFLFILAWPIAYFYRKRRKHIWLLCEYGAEARDNAYYLFRYLRREHPEIDAVYALDKNSIDRDRVTPLGEVVRYGSLKHWV